MSDLYEAFKNTRQNVSDAAVNANRNPDDVTLIAVSKTKPASMIRDLYDCGVRDFGENKVQELAEKYEELPKDIRWHMIGHLQRNKVKYIIDKVALIHSVDSLRLAETIEKEAVKKGIDHVDVLLEINVSGEESKFGLTPAELKASINEFLAFEHIHVKGLMTVAPYVENPEDVRHYFKELRELMVDIQSQIGDNIIVMDRLSMGMSGDFEIAIAEGANFVRVGTRIFGERNYNI